MLTLPTPARRRRRDDWHRSDGGVWLPRDPLRGAGMVRRGMGFGFEPAGCCCGDFVLCPFPQPCGNCEEGEPEFGDNMPVTVTGIFGECEDCERYDSLLNISVPFPRNLSGCLWRPGRYYLTNISCWLAWPEVEWSLLLLGCKNPTYYFWWLHVGIDAGFYNGFSHHNTVTYISEIFDEKPLCFNTQYNLSLYEITSGFTDPEGYLYCDYSESSAVIGPMVK